MLGLRSYSSQWNILSRGTEATQTQQDTVEANRSTEYMGESGGGRIQWESSELLFSNNVMWRSWGWNKTECRCNDKPLNCSLLTWFIHSCFHPRMVSLPASQEKSILRFVRIKMFLFETFVSCHTHSFLRYFLSQYVISSWYKVQVVLLEKEINISIQYGDADFLFQQDLAPAHSATTTGNWFVFCGNQLSLQDCLCQFVL